MSNSRRIASSNLPTVFFQIGLIALWLCAGVSCEPSKAPSSSDTTNRSDSITGANSSNTANSSTADTRTSSLPKDASSQSNTSLGNLRFRQVDHALPGSEFQDGSDQELFSLLETTGGGCAIIDYDGDGRLDIVTSGGGYFDAADKSIRGHAGNLFRQVNPWNFDAKAQAACLDFSATYHSAIIAADYDSDGMKDLLVTGFDRLQWFRNQGDGTFQTESPLEDKLWSSSAVFFDADQDSDLDLYVVHYANWSWDNHPWCPSQSDSNRRDYCGPTDFVGLQDSFYENLSDGSFAQRSVEAASGLALRGLGVIAADLDGDRDTDLYVSNDVEPNLLYRNEGGFRWTELGRRAGVATNDQGRAEGSMGIALGDYNNDQKFDLWVTNYADEFNALYRGNGRLSFSYASNAARITATDEQSVGWGTAMCDLELDGDEDIIVINGHLERYSPNHSQRPQVLENIEAKRFAIAAKESPFFQTAQDGRGLAIGDLNRDGLIDMAVTCNNAPCVLVENQSERQGRYLCLRLVGRTSNRDAIGSVATLTFGDSTWIRQRVGGGSYASTNDSALHFGIPQSFLARLQQNRTDALKATLKIDWPSGQSSEIAIDQLDTELLIVEPAEGLSLSTYEMHQ